MTCAVSLPDSSFLDGTVLLMVTHVMFFLTGLVADAGKLRRLSCSQDDIIYFLPVAATSLRAGFQVDVIKAARYDLLIHCLIS